MGITISGSVSAETTFMLPKRQKAFGQGENGVFDSTNSYSWGPEVTGQSYTKWDGTTANMQIFDNVKNFFDTGVNLSESISFQQQYDKTSIYTSLNRMDDSSMIPGANLSRTNLTLRASSTFGKDDRWSLMQKYNTSIPSQKTALSVVHVGIMHFILFSICLRLLTSVTFPALSKTNSAK